jgi:hypothetical protein
MFDYNSTPKEETSAFSAEQLAPFIAKRDELTANSDRPVHMFLLKNQKTGEPVVAYVKEPNYVSKVALMDSIISKGAVITGETMREACLIEKESHPLTYGNAPECDEYKLSIAINCIGLIKSVADEYKKKLTSTTSEKTSDIA